MWLDSGFKQRFALNLYEEDTGFGASEDIQWDIDDDFDWFWSNVYSATGNDVKITMPDGVTPISNAEGNCVGWDLCAGTAVPGTAFDKATRVGGIRVDGWSTAPSQGTADTTTFIWVYFNNSSGGPHTDGSPVAFTDTKVVEALTQASVGKGARGARVLCGPEAPGATAPRHTFAMTSGETFHVYWDFRQELLRSQWDINGQKLYEELDYCTVVTENAGAGDITVQASTCFLAGGGVIRTAHTGGASGTDYTAILTATTTLGRVLDRRCLLKCIDTDET